MSTYAGVDGWTVVHPLFPQLSGVDTPSTPSTPTGSWGGHVGHLVHPCFRSSHGVDALSNRPPVTGRTLPAPGDPMSTSEVAQ